MANSLVWQLLWVLAVILIGCVMYGAWTGPFRSVSNLSRWAERLRAPYVPEWLRARAADRWAFRGGLVSLALLLAVAWIVPSRTPPDMPATAPDDRGPVAPAPPSEKETKTRPDRHIDADLQNAIRVHVPKTKKIKLVVLNGDAEADQFSWEIDAFLRAEGYQVVSPRVLFAMTAGAATPTGTAIYPDEKDQNILIIRIGLNDRN